MENQEASKKKTIFNIHSSIDRLNGRKDEWRKDSFRILVLTF